MRRLGGACGRSPSLPWRDSWPPLWMAGQELSGDGLIQAELSAARKGDCTGSAPAYLADGFGKLDALLSELLDGLLDVLTHEVEIVPGRPVGRMDRDLSRRKRENEPPSASINFVACKDFLQDSPGLFRGPGIDKRMCAVDHCSCLLKFEDTTALAENLIPRLAAETKSAEASRQ